MERFVQIPTNQQTLKKQSDDAKTWETLDDSKSLSDSGFSTQNAKAQHPAIVALCLIKGIQFSYWARILNLHSHRSSYLSEMNDIIYCLLRTTIPIWSELLHVQYHWTLFESI